MAPQQYLYEVAYRDGHRVLVAVTLATDEADARAQFVAPVVRVTKPTA